MDETPTRDASSHDQEGFGAVDAGAAPVGLSDPVDGAPSDNTTLVAVLQAFEEQGFAAQFIAEPDGRVACVACGRTVAATDLDVRATRRLEGASDPDDMMTVIAARCPDCATAGTLVLGYGPNASQDDISIYRAIGGQGERSDEVSAGPDDDGALALDPDAPGASLFLDGDDVEPNEPA